MMTASCNTTAVEEPYVSPQRDPAIVNNDGISYGNGLLLFGGGGWGH